MQSQKRIFVNTLAQYTRTVINAVLSLYSTRLVLSILGVNDFGIYSVIGGVIAMLSFITSALVTTTQRYISFYQGRGDKNKLKQIFNNSLILHIIVGILVVIVLELVAPLLFNGFLNINSLRISAAKNVYQIVAIILFVTFITSPFQALLVSHENIVYISIIDVFSSVLKVILVIGLQYIYYDKLVSYGLLMLLIQLFSFFAITLFSFFKYEECILPRFSLISKSYIKDLSSFTGWTIYSTGCIVGRTQGIAIILNHFIGSTINAAYGIGFQVSSYVSFISQSLLNAINPQLMKAEGIGDRQRMFRFAEMESKIGFFLLSALAIPCIFEMPKLLSLWLNDVPVYSVLFSRMVLLAAIVDLLTVGLGSANSAIGNIREYSLVVNSIKLLTLPFVFVFIILGYSVLYVAIFYVFFEFVCAMVRIPFLEKNGGLIVKDYVCNVLGKIFLPFLSLIVMCYVCTLLFDFTLRFLVTFTIPVLFYAYTIYLFGLNKSEKLFVDQLLCRFVFKK